MSFVNFKIPVLVQNKRLEKQSIYAIRPLFSNYPIVSNRRFDKAETDFKKAVRKSLNNYKLNRNNIDNLLWYLFNPEVKYQVLKLTIPIGKQYVKGAFGLATFELQNKLFFCLPAFDNYLFFENKPQFNHANLEEKVVHVITQLFRKLKNNLNDEFQSSAYFAESGEFITHISISLNIQSGSFDFEQEETPWYFSKINSDSDFDGAVEIEKVGENINNNYPGNLKRSFYRDELVDQLYSIIYKPENTPIALVGPEGVGKNTIIHELVFQYLTNKEEDLKSEADPTGKEELYANVWHIDPTRIISGMSIVGWWQKRLESIIDFVMYRKKMANMINC